MKIRYYQQDLDYKTLCDWWSAWPNWTPIHADCLPSTGLVVCDSTDEALCAGFIYQTDSSIAWLEWLISDPKLPKPFRASALDFLLNELKLEAKRLGFKQIFTSTDREGLKSRLVGHGFLVTDKKVNFLICPLGE